MYAFIMSQRMLLHCFFKYVWKLLHDVRYETFIETVEICTDSSVLECAPQ